MKAHIERARVELETAAAAMERAARDLASAASEAPEAAHPPYCGQRRPNEAMELVDPKLTDLCTFAMERATEAERIRGQAGSLQSYLEQSA